MFDLLIIIIIVIVIIIIIWLFSNSQQLDKKFYEPYEVENNLDSIYENLDKIKSECLGLTDWIAWPEQELYANDGKWSVIPFYGFGIWLKSTCDKCPVTTKFLKNIKGLKLATLSKLSPGMKLIPHNGWASHSNYVIRCHFGIVVPENKCYISVREDANDPEEIKFHSENKWLIFDDSKIHYAENKSESDRIVLIIDIERPDHIKQGTSTSKDTDELIQFVEEFRKLNK